MNFYTLPYPLKKDETYPVAVRGVEKAERHQSLIVGFDYVLILAEPAVEIGFHSINGGRGLRFESRPVEGHAAILPLLRTFHDIAGDGRRLDEKGEQNQRSLRQLQPLSNYSAASFLLVGSLDQKSKSCRDRNDIAADAKSYLLNSHTQGVSIESRLSIPRIRSGVRVIRWIFSWISSITNL